MMEYVIVAVLIVAACVAAVVVFSRTLLRGFDTASLGAMGDAENATQSHRHYSEETEKNIQSSKEYHDAMHDMDMK